MCETVYIVYILDVIYLGQWICLLFFFIGIMVIMLALWAGGPWIGIPSLGPSMVMITSMDTHTHTHTHIYIYATWWMKLALSVVLFAA